MSDEKVLCVREESINKHLFSVLGDCFERSVITGITENDVFSRILLHEDLEVLPRSLVEGDPTYRQIIPYQVIKTEKGTVLLYQRRSSSTEERLQDLYSIGIGGHVNSDDLCFSSSKEILVWETIQNAKNRELEEEILNPLKLTSYRFLGLIKSNLTPVCKVHLGLAYETTVEWDSWGSVYSNELDIKGFIFPSALKNYNLEKWSEFLLRFV